MRKAGKVLLKQKGMVMVLALAMCAAAGCMSKGPYTVAVAEEKAVSHCRYLDTLQENSDMGGVQIHPKLTYDGRDKVLRRAEMIGATHVVWVADQTFSSAAMAYTCRE